jgi:hypothetical protein
MGPTMIEFQCPSCFFSMKAKESLVGKKVRCKQCNESITVEAYVPPEDDEDELPLSPAAAPRSRGKKKKSRSGGVMDHPAMKIALKFGPYLVALGLLIGLFVGAASNKKFADNFGGICAGVGIVIWLIDYLWALSLAAQEDPAAWLGLMLPRFGLRMIMSYREIMRGPFIMFMIGLCFLGVGSVMLLIHNYKPEAR